MTLPAQTAQRKRGVGGWIARVLAAIGVLVLALIAATAIAGAVAKANLARQYPAPGQLVDVGGYNLHIYCTGQGSPTVLLEAGQGDFSLSWARVQSEIAKFARVCSYDRAGAGWSEPSPKPRTAETMVDELDTLLTHAGIEGPVVVVGHSLGGMLMRLYAHEHPDAVIGMVLVDSLHEDLPVRFPEYARLLAEQVGQFGPLAWLRAAGIVALAPANIPTTGLPDEAAAQYRAVIATGTVFETIAAEMSAAVENCAAVRAAGITSLGDIPLVVLTAGLAEALPGVSAEQNQQWRATWLELQSELLALSPRSRQVMAEQSGHVIQLQQPDLVVDAVRQVIAATNE
jgi:pimeloyl-ACP methyl ester carboxylesterase